jgi:DNA polymerase
MNTNADRALALRRLAIGYQVDRAPSLARLRAHAQYVPGRGSLRPRYAFIGEAPGAAEDRQRRPFCGPSGRMLDEMLASIGLERKDVWVTNIVKYRPPDNRDPSPAEKAASLPYLLKELEMVGAEYWVTLGRHALTALLPGVRLASVRGQWQAGVTARPLMPLFHPAVALYRSSMRATLLGDFAKLKEVPQ